MSSTETVDFPYRAMSRAAVTSVIFAVVALPGLVPDFSALLVVTLFGLACGAVGLRAIYKFPQEFSGKSLAVTGILANLLIVSAGIGFNAYIYFTEVPDGYTRVGFYELQTADNEPDGPAERAFDIDKQKIFLKGYIHPSSGNGALKHFILVPDFGTCCFGGQPKSTDMIEVTLVGGQTTKAALVKRKLAGTFHLIRTPQKVSDEFDNKVYYQMLVDDIK